MPYFPGAGYGIANALSGLASAELKRKYHEEEQALKQRQMKVVEDAEVRARDATDQNIEESRERMAALRGKAESDSFVADAMLANGSAEQEQPKQAQPEQAQPDQAQGGQAQPDQAQPEQEQGDGYDFTESGVDYQYGKGGSTPYSPQRPGERVRTEALGKVTTEKDAKGKAASGEYGLGAKTADAARQGKAAFSPTEGAGLLESSRREHQRAEEIRVGLEKALAAVDSRYGGDPRLATYIKANLKSKLSGVYQDTLARARKLEADGNLANFAQLGAAAAGKVLGHLALGGTVDAAFLKDNAELFNKAGLDATMFAGLRRAGGRKGDDPLLRGMVVNDKGGLFPEEAIARLANPALPWTERVKGWEDVSKFAKLQMEMRMKARELAMQDPLARDKFYLNVNREAVSQFSKDTASFEQLWRNACRQDKTEMPVMGLKTPEGKVVKIKPPLLFTEWKSKDDIMAAFDATMHGDENARNFYNYIWRPLNTRMWQTGAIASMTSAHFKVPPPTQSEFEKAREKSRGTETGKLEAVNAEAERRKNLQPPPAKPGTPGYPASAAQQEETEGFGRN